MEHLLNFTSERRDKGNQTFSLLWGGDSSQSSTRVDLEGCIHLQDLLSGVTASVRQIMGKTCQSFGGVKRGHFMKSSPMGLWREILKVGKQHSKERKSVSLQLGPPPDSAKKPGEKTIIVSFCCTPVAPKFTATSGKKRTFSQPSALCLVKYCLDTWIQVTWTHQSIVTSQC